ncbi:MAG TPA: TIGR04222 domain-containing membrane protein, partial [Allocoleopsis sp.]
MDIIWHNPLANMYGPHFLIFYAVVIIITLIFCAKNDDDPTEKLPLPSIPEKPDPYTIAYLSSGYEGVKNVAILSLMEQGYLEDNGNQEIMRSLYSPHSDHLLPIEQDILTVFSSPISTKSLKSSLTISQIVRKHCSVYLQEFTNQRFLFENKSSNYRKIKGLYGGFMIMGLGLYKLLAALKSGHHNVGFLILMGLIGMIILIVIDGMLPPRLSNLGQRYLSSLQRAFTNIKQQIKEDKNLDLFLLLIALFGTSSLLG